MVPTSSVTSILFLKSLLKADDIVNRGNVWSRLYNVYREET